jgi:hypothetical protein
MITYSMIFFFCFVSTRMCGSFPSIISADNVDEKIYTTKQSLVFCVFGINYTNKYIKYACDIEIFMQEQLFV